MKKITNILIGLFLSVLFAFPVFAAERVLTVGGNAASRPLSDFFLYQVEGTNYYVNSAVTASGSCKSLATACKTITAAQALAVAGDTIFIKGSFNEAVTLTSKAGVRFIGIGTTTNRALWTAPDTTAPALTIAASADVWVENIRFRPPVANAAISLTGASHQATIKNCRFQGKTGSKYGILTDGSQANVHILGNEFFYINTATGAYAIYGETYATAEPAGWILEGNKFHSNLNHLVCRLRQSIVRENVFAAGGLAADGSTSATLTVLGIDISGATGGINTVTRNDLGGLYHTAHYKPGTSDEWSGNFCADRTHATQVDATTGISKTVPVP
jgi:hypothetical protein